MQKTIIDGITTYRGLCYDLLNEMAASINFRYGFFDVSLNRICNIIFGI